MLLYLAEDSLVEVKKRLAFIAQTRDLDLSDLPLYALTIPRLCVDRERDQKRLRATLERLKPKLLVLDPLVRISRADENNANEISEVLGYLREIQREFSTSVILVHHIRKPRDGRRIGGSELRGSSDLYAWGDSFVFISKAEKGLVATVEHRAARAPEDFGLQLLEDDQGIRLQITTPIKETTSQEVRLRTRILETLSRAGTPQSVNALWECLRVSKDRIRATLLGLQEEGLVVEEGGAYRCQ